MIPAYTLRLCNGRQLHVSCKGKGSAVRRILLNGKPIVDARLEHSQLMEGGSLVFEMKKEKAEPVRFLPPEVIRCLERRPLKSFADYTFHYTLNRQFRSWPVSMEWQGDTLLLSCNKALYRIPRSTFEHADRFCWLIPHDGAEYNHVAGTFGFVSQKAIRSLQLSGEFVYDTITWRLIDENDTSWHVQADIDRTEMWILKDESMPIVLEMRNNPLGIDWRAEKQQD